MLQSQRLRHASGMTFVELLTVIAIVGLLFALLLPAVQAARESARRVTCLSNLKGSGLSAQNYHSVNESFPTGGRLAVQISGHPALGSNLWIELLSFLERSDLSETWDHDDNRNNVVGGRNATQAQVIGALICPSDYLPETVTTLTDAYSAAPAWSHGFYGMSSYGGVAGSRAVNPGGPPDFNGVSRDGVFFLDSRIRLADITDGSSKTLLFGERYHDDPEFDLRRPAILPGVAPMAALGRWGYVANSGVMANATLHAAVQVNFRAPPLANRQAMDDRVCAFGSGHPGGANFALADGSVRFIADSLPLTHLRKLSVVQDD